MKIILKAKSIIIKKRANDLTVEVGKTRQNQLTEGCLVGGTIPDDGSEPSFYCVDDGCEDCELKSEDHGDGEIEYWCECGSENK